MVFHLCYNSVGRIVPVLRMEGVMIELVLVWSDGEQCIYTVNDVKTAEEMRDNMLLVFGGQIEFCDWRYAY